jgi:hypothetical protein
MEKINQRRKAITLVELLIAILLLSVVLLTANSIELAMRRMQLGPTIQVALMNELTPAMTKIKKAYESHLGSLDNSSVIIETGGRGLEIRIDDSVPYGQVDAGDTWVAFRWNGTEGNPIEYYEDNTTFIDNIAEGICDFFVSSQNGNPNEAVTVNIYKKRIPGQPEDWYNNTAMNLSSTIFARGSSLK